MNKKFTKLIAALALLVFMTPSMVGWGQTRDNVTLTKTMNQVVEENNYTVSSGNNATCYTSIDLNNYINMSTSGTPNCGSFWGSTTKDWRLYQTQSGDVTISVTDGTLVSVKFTYNASNTGTLKNGSTAVSSGTTVNASGTSITLTVGNTGNATNGQVRITAVEVVYSTGGSTTPSISITPATAQPFTYVVGNGPSEEQVFVVTGSNLTSVITASVPSDCAFEITDDVTYGNSVTIGDGDYISVRMKADKSAGTYNTILTLSSEGADDVTVSLTGTVSNPSYAITVDSQITGGSIEADKETAEEGQTVTLTAQPDDGYYLASWTVLKDDMETPVSVTNNQFAMPNCAVYVTATFTPYTVTLNAGNGTVNNNSTMTWNVSMNNGNLPDAVSPCSDIWSFGGWSLTQVDNETTTNPGFVATQYVPTSNVTLYAVYTRSEGVTFDNTTGGDFYIYATVGETNYYAIGTSSKLSATTDISEATLYTFEKLDGEGEFAIKSGTAYLSWSSGANFATSNSAYTWTIEEGEYGSWRPLNGDESRSIAYRTTNVFGPYSTGNIDGTEYFDIEIGGGTVTYATSPSCNELVATPTFTVTGTAIGGEENTYNGAISVAINCTTEDATIQYKLTENGEWQNYSQALSVSQSTTIWAMATKNGMDDSEVAEATYTIKYTLTLDDTDIKEIFVFGDDPNEAILKISEGDTITSTTVEAGTEIYVSVSAVVDCKIFDGLIVLDSNSQPVDTILIDPMYFSFTMPASNTSIAVSTSDAPEHTLTLGTLSNVTLALTMGEDSNDVTITNNVATLCEGIHVTVIATPANGYVMESESVSVVYNNNQPVEVTFEGTNDGEYIYSFEMPTGNVTITATAVYNPIATATLSSSNMANMTSGGEAYNNLKYITVNGLYWESNGSQAHPSGGSTYGMLQLRNRTNSAGVSYIKLPAFNGKIESITLAVTNGNATSSNGGVCKTILAFQAGVTSSESVIVSGGDSNYGTNEITLDLSNTFYSTGYITVTGSNAARIWNIDVTYRLYQDMTGNTLETIGNDATVSIPAGANVTAENLTIPASSGIVIKSGAMLTVSGTLTNNGNANNIIIEDGGQLKFYDNGAKGAPQATVKYNIDAWTAGTTGGWYFISSPINVSNLDPSTVANMLPADGEESGETVRNYDLYWLDNTVWRNYRKNSFNLANGQGYLYARSEANTLEFAGAIKPYDADYTIPVSEGWNLIGNPYTIKAYPNTAYYTVNDANAGITAETGTTSDVAVAPCTGVIVKAENAGTVKFLDAVPSNSINNGNIQMTLAQQATNRGNATTLDNAIVSFNEGSQLGKFYFGTQNANLYIPQGTEEYAIVSTEAQGTMPVNFRANENGQYTLTVNPENVEMNYLHLIDNMTGADIDLLANPSYSFNATTTDYESRFKLVFATNNEDGASTGSAAFAFYSNGNWIINNPSTGSGPATLQVVDLMGRILSSETVNGSVSKTINATPGVYMLRLINGENVKVQKIVVR